MKLSKRLKSQFKNANIKILAIIVLVSLTLTACMLARFSMFGNKDLQSNEEIFTSEVEGADKRNAESVVVVCDSIVQGVRDNDLEDGTYTFRVTGQTSSGTTETKDYSVELINYYDDVTYTENVSLGDSTTEYKMLVVKYHKNLTINSGVTVTATNVSNLTYKKGMYLCVMGTLTNNGTITMTARGTYNVSGENVYLWKNVNSSFEYVPASGAAGLVAYQPYYVASSANGRVGNNGKNRATGGGGQGGVIINGLQGSAGSYLGASTGGSSYAGGNGSGAIVRCNSSAVAASYTEASSVKGGNGSAWDGGSETYYVAGGGAGQTPGSTSYCRIGSGNTETVAQTGVGGLLVLYADNLNNYGTISSNGSNGAGAWCYLPGKYRGAAGGGGSGGGSVNIFTNSMSVVGTIVANGGKGGNVQSCTNGNMGYREGGNGGNGSVTITQLMPNVNYSTKQIKLKVGETFQIDQNEIKLINQNETQTGLVSIQNLKYEIVDDDIAQVSNNGLVTGLKAGKTKLKITETTNNISVLVYLEVINNTKIDVQEGQNFTVALKQNGTVWSYGLNDKGQLGIGNNDNKSTPTKVEGLSNVKQIAVGDSHSLVLLENGNVYAWGKRNQWSTWLWRRRR